MSTDKNGNPDMTRSLPWPPLQSEQAEQLQRVKLKFNDLLAECGDAACTSKEEHRLMALARTNLELAAMWAVKAITCDRT